MNVIIRADVLAPVEWRGVVVGPYLAAGALPDEYVVRLSDGRTVALRPHEFYPAPWDRLTSSPASRAVAFAA